MPKRRSGLPKNNIHVQDVKAELEMYWFYLSIISQYFQTFNGHLRVLLVNRFPTFSNTWEQPFRHLRLAC